GGGGGTRSVLLFGGSFDPPTLAHTRLPPRVRDALGLDWALYLPAARSPLKSAAPGASAQDRLDMLAAALAGAERCSIGTLELDRGDAEPSYTVDTLRTLRRALGPSVTLRLLIGTDQAAQFHRWREPREVLALAEPVVITRPDAGADGALPASMAERWRPDEMAAWRRRLVRVPPIDASSTEARALLSNDATRDAPRLLELLPGPVLHLIRDRALYKAP
ncbi:MAG TPA: nicotinate (nicotinamide) nucleotide adenylyltransferase, partial [Phycisphaerales bacterium]|nr:nicotinate (nicotinamide) nucleotide adenylyltransferase [Phycisphaerales bacterium]